jgi:predicted GNAT family acetyltransferase
MESLIEHDREASCFHTYVESHRAELDYGLEDGVMTITHTGVPGPIEGRGIAASLMKAALATARAEGWKVVPSCAYAAAYMRRHAQQVADLLA